MSKVTAVSACVLCGVLIAGSAVAQIARRPVITASGADAAIRACETLATQRGWHMNIWVFDSTGSPVAFKRMDGATWYGIESSRAKAETSSQEIRPSGAYAGFPPTVVSALNIFPGKGGYPVVINGEIAGSVGVGGAGDDNDEECAIAGADAVLRAAGAPPWRAPAGRGGAPAPQAAPAR